MRDSLERAASARPPRSRWWRWGLRGILVVLILAAFWISEAARRSPHPLPEFAMPCVAGWWPWGNIAIEIGDGETRAACLTVPKAAIVGQQGARWAELDLTRLGDDADCLSALTSQTVRIEMWNPAKAPQPSTAKPAWSSDFPAYLRFPSGSSAAGTEVFVPRDRSSGLRTISCLIDSDKCWAAARDDLLFVKWPTSRQRLSAGLDQDWNCVRATLQAARID